jgi:UDP-glucose 4-epimerase
MPRLVYASSSSVYGLNKKQPFSESDRVDNPASLYASTKRVRLCVSHNETSESPLQKLLLQLCGIVPLKLAMDRCGWAAHELMRVH